jgi:hypothetical protein
MGKLMLKKIEDAAAIWVSADGETEIVTTGPQIRLGGEGGEKSAFVRSPRKN